MKTTTHLRNKPGVRLIRFSDGSWRCVDCKGYGLVRARGPRAGEHYTTLRGAQAALANGGARDCGVCDGTGLLGMPSTLRLIGTAPVREDTASEHEKMGIYREPVEPAPF